MEVSLERGLLNSYFNDRCLADGLAVGNATNSALSEKSVISLYCITENPYLIDVRHFSFSDASTKMAANKQRNIAVY
jgi:hypothetical protein